MLKTRDELAAARRLLTALFEAHGQPGGGDGRTLVLPQFKEGTMEKTAAFMEYETINSQDVEMTYIPISLDLLDNIDSDENYPVLFRLVEAVE